MVAKCFTQNKKQKRKRLVTILPVKVAKRQLRKKFSFEPCYKNFFVKALL